MKQLFFVMLKSSHQVEMDRGAVAQVAKVKGFGVHPMMKKLPETLPAVTRVVPGCWFQTWVTSWLAKQIFQKLFTCNEICDSDGHGWSEIVDNLVKNRVDLREIDPWLRVASLCAYFVTPRISGTGLLWRLNDVVRRRRGIQLITREIFEIGCVL